jgi:hypothetical protein
LNWSLFRKHTNAQQGSVSFFFFAFGGTVLREGDGFWFGFSTLASLRFPVPISVALWSTGKTKREHHNGALTCLWYGVLCFLNTRGVKAWDLRTNLAGRLQILLSW